MGGLATLGERRTGLDMQAIKRAAARELRGLRG
jgi:hypothetical protein